MPPTTLPPLGEAGSHDEILLFVYGTLQRGHRRSATMAGQRFLGPARTTCDYRLYDCGSYPGLVETAEGGCEIEGELWEVDPARLAVLDRVENVAGNLYRRSRVRLQPPFDHASVQTYFYQQPIDDLPDCGSRWEG